MVSCTGPTNKKEDQTTEKNMNNDQEQSTEDKSNMKPEAFVYEGHDFYMLPYQYNALEPVIDALTVETHYSKHHKGYFTKYIDAVKGTDLENNSLEDFLGNISLFTYLHVREDIIHI